MLGSVSCLCTHSNIKRHTGFNSKTTYVTLLYSSELVAVKASSITIKTRNTSGTTVRSAISTKISHIGEWKRPTITHKVGQGHGSSTLVILIGASDPANLGIEPQTRLWKNLPCCQSRPTLILRVETSSLVPRSSVSYLFARPRRLSLRSPQADRLRWAFAQGRWKRKVTARLHLRAFEGASSPEGFLRLYIKAI